jgi:hypothetical protein
MTVDFSGLRIHLVQIALFRCRQGSVQRIALEAIMRAWSYRPSLRRDRPHSPPKFVATVAARVTRAGARSTARCERFRSQTYVRNVRQCARNAVDSTGKTPCDTGAA